MELMVHRCTKEDDSRGVGEALCEEAFGQGLVSKNTNVPLMINLKDYCS